MLKCVVTMEWDLIKVGSAVVGLAFFLVPSVLCSVGCVCVEVTAVGLESPRWVEWRSQHNRVVEVEGASGSIWYGTKTGMGT